MSNYRRFAAAILVSTLVMFGLICLTTYTLDQSSIRSSAMSKARTAAFHRIVMPDHVCPYCLVLSNTCPQGGAMRSSVACNGQMSDNPKQTRTAAGSCSANPCTFSGSFALTISGQQGRLAS